MGIASMVIGIISALLGFIPFCNYFALIPAGVGFILGVIDLILKSSKKEKGIGFAISGIILNTIAIILIILWTALFAVAVADEDLYSTTNTETETSNNKIETAAIEYTDYSVSELMDDLDNNALKAEKQYMDTYVSLTGRLNAIDSDGAYISIAPKNKMISIFNVTCYINDDEQLNKVIEMQVNDIITVHGKITAVGEILGYTLEIHTIE